MPKERSLKAALDRHTGRDYKQEKQHKQQKEASKRKRERVQKDIEDDAVEELGGVALDAAQAEAAQLWKELNEAEPASGSDSDDENEGTFDLSRIVDSDSDSDDESEVIETGGAALNGSLAPISTLPNSDAPTNGTSEHLEEEEDEDEDSDNESIALSDISAGPDEEDLIPHQRLTINNTTALTKALKSISLPYDTLAFSDHQSITTPAPVTITDSNDDVERETAFYAQSLSAVQTARKHLKKEGVPFTRPTDYFAEMVKTDEHMSKIKAKLMDDAASKKASAEARKQRDLKKFGKQVQNERLQERAKEKRTMLDKVKVLERKRAQGDGAHGDREADLFDVALDDAAAGEKKERRGEGPDSRRGRDRDGNMGAKRVKKNEKFGFGGSKRNAKRSDAASTGDMSSFSTKRMKGQSSGSGRGGGSARGGKQRLGKSRRNK